jgi:hypothetical protein
MQNMRRSMSSGTMVRAGRNHLTALDRTPETKHLIDAFQPVQENLQISAAARVMAEDAMGAPRVVVRFVERDLEKVIREIAFMAHAADNNATSGPAFKALFPDGLDGVVRPLGAAQVAAAQALRQRLDSQPAAATIKAQVMEKLDKAIAAFKASVDARQAADTRVSETRAVELGARERFIKAYDSNIGAIRQIFPRDRDQQDLYFDEVSTSHASSDATGDDEGDAPTVPTAPNTDTKTK